MTPDDKRRLVTTPKWARRRGRKIVRDLSGLSLEYESDVVTEAIVVAHREGFEAGRDGAADVAEALGQHSGTNVQPAIASIVRELRLIPYPDPVEKEGSDV